MSSSSSLEAQREHDRIPLSKSRAIYIDCFSGIAGDMLLAALIDCANQLGETHFLDKIKTHMQSLHEISGQWDLSVSRVSRSEGCITGMHATVHSIFDHKQLPPPGSTSFNFPTEDGHDHSHSHSHTHTHYPDSTTNGNQAKAGNAMDSTNHSHSHSHSIPNTHPRNLSFIESLIESSSLEPVVKSLCIKAFTELAIAESRVHGASIENVHFHEVGAIDSIIDTCGCILACHLLGVDFDQVYCSALPTGTGTVQTTHGLLPVPAPATAYLMRGMVLSPGPKGITGELVTPTGASLVRALCNLPSLECPSMCASTRQGKLPPGISLLAVGVGCGTKDFPKHPNILRVLLGEQALIACKPAPASAPASPSQISPSSVPPWSEEPLVILQANVDDASAEMLSHVMGRALILGALDCWQEGIVMKKGRLASQLNILCRSASEERSKFVMMLFEESTTIGIRAIETTRYALRREIVTIPLPLREGCSSSVRAKASFLGDRMITLKPEYDDCSRVARERGVPLKEFMASIGDLSLTKG